MTLRTDLTDEVLQAAVHAAQHNEANAAILAGSSGPNSLLSASLAAPVTGVATAVTTNVPWSADQQFGTDITVDGSDHTLLHLAAGTYLAMVDVQWSGGDNMLVHVDEVSGTWVMPYDASATFYTDGNLNFAAGALVADRELTTTILLVVSDAATFRIGSMYRSAAGPFNLSQAGIDIRRIL